MHDSISNFLLPTNIEQIIEQRNTLFPLNEVAKTFSISHSTIVAGVFILCFLLLAIYFVQPKKKFKSLFTQITLPDNSNQSMKKSSGDNFFSLLLLSIVSIVGIFMLYLILQNHFVKNQSLYENSSIDILLSLSALSIILALIAAYNLLLLIILTNFFDVNKENLLTFGKISVNLVRVLGVCLLFVSFLAVYMSEQWFIMLIAIGITLVGLSVLALIISYFRIFFNGIGTLFYFFLYLCTLEILPILVIKKLVLNFIC